MKRLLPWFYVLSATGFVSWIAWTSPTVKECLTNQYENYGSDPLQEKITSFYEFLVGSRLCVGEFIHVNSEGIIAVFTIILGIATWFLWRATRNLVEDARATGTKQLDVAKIAADAAKKAADVAEATLTASQRPWVSFTVKIKGPLVFDSGGSGVKLEITSSNTGPTPALDVFVHPIISPGPSGAYQPIEILKQAITTTHMPVGLGHALFKGSYFTEDNTPSMALEAFQNIPVLAPHIAIVARYKFSFSDDFHHTAQLYILARIDHQHPGQAFVISPGVEVPANMLRLQLLGSYAD